MKYTKIIEKLSSFSQLKKDVLQKSVSHAYLLKSEDDDLMKEFALLFAAEILSADSKDSLRTTHNVLTYSHPDVFFYPKKADGKIVVEDISEIFDTSILAGMESEKKVYILYNVEKMQQVTQNKLLKILEEPPKGVHFILLCKNEAAMLLTIKSRVKPVEIERLSKDVIYDHLIQIYPDAEKVKAASDSAGGVITRAEAMLCSEDYFTLYNDMFALMRDFTHSSKLLEKAKMLSRYESRLEQALYILSQVLRDAMIIKVDPEFILNKEKETQIKEIATAYPQAALICAIEQVNLAKAKLSMNCNKTQIIDGLLIGILEVRGKCLI